MDFVIWAGVMFSVVGLAGLILSILKVSRAKKAGLDDDALRGELQKALPLNLGSLAVSFLGLMMVVVGVMLS